MNSSIWPIARTLTGSTTSGQSGTESNGNEGMLYIPQSSKTRASPWDHFVSYPGHIGGGYLSAEVKSSYSTSPADRALASSQGEGKLSLQTSCRPGKGWAA